MPTRDEDREPRGGGAPSPRPPGADAGGASAEEAYEPPRLVKFEKLDRLIVSGE